MQKTKKLLALLACAVLLCLVLPACKKAKTDESTLVGTWELTERSGHGGAALDKLANEGFNVFLVLDEDGTGSLELFGRRMQLTWEAGKNATGTLTLEGEKAKLSLDEDDRLVMADDGQTLTFVRVDPAQKVSLSDEAG